jgi:hypothetical protein
MTTSLLVGTTSTAINLPLIPVGSGRTAGLPAPEPRAHAPDAADGPLPEPPVNRISFDQLTGTTTVQTFESWAYHVGGRKVTNTEHETWETRDADPGHSRFLGEEWHRLEQRGRRLDLRTRIEILSDSLTLHVVVTRALASGGKTVKTMTWDERLPRTAH